MREIKFVRVISGANETNPQRGPKPQGAFFSVTSSNTRVGKGICLAYAMLQPNMAPVYNIIFNIYELRHFIAHENICKT